MVRPAPRPPVPDRHREIRACSLNKPVLVESALHFVFLSDEVQNQPLLLVLLSDQIRTCSLNQNVLGESTLLFVLLSAQVFTCKVVFLTKDQGNDVHLDLTSHLFPQEQVNGLFLNRRKKLLRLKKVLPHDPLQPTIPFSPADSDASATRMKKKLRSQRPDCIGDRQEEGKAGQFSPVILLDSDRVNIPEMLKKRG